MQDIDNDIFYRPMNKTTCIKDANTSRVLPINMYYSGSTSINDRRFDIGKSNTKLFQLLVYPNFLVLKKYK